MKTETPQTIFLNEYQVPEFLIEKVDLHFNIQEDFTEVTTKSSFKRNPKAQTKSELLNLDGSFFKLQSLALDSRALSTSDYSIQGDTLTLKVPSKETFELHVVTRVEPAKNTALEGLYQSGSILCTQNEAQGFRRITYFVDRPDVMAVYKTTIEADKKKYPQLLANGNLIHTEDLPSGRHGATWEDPHPKPCYLFALVAGDLGKVEGEFVTQSGRKVLLQVFVEKGEETRAQFSLEALKRSMAWDEERYGLEYDLDIYMIVAVSSFNAGAMENKGLNIFNSKYILADPKTTTDSEYKAIEAVIGHEYFHNWTGNRVTCRDWFQLSLKEGLTVYRDQEFSSDLHSRSVERIKNVSKLRSFQFAEDAGPMAHPIRPQSYIAVNNFYTATVYEKGSEVVRMVETLIGRDNFRKGMDKYFELYDGQAVTTEDFVNAMEIASGKDLAQFKNWYNQAGTPQVSYEAKYLADQKKYVLTLTQSCAPTPGQPEKKPFHIPVAVGLLDSKGQDMELKLEDSKAQGEKTLVLELKEPSQTFSFLGISEKPTLSLLRGFSAPVQVTTDRTDEELIFLMKNDSDEFSRWDAGQKVITQWIVKGVKDKVAGRELTLDPGIGAAFGDVLRDPVLDPSFKALMFQIPDMKYLSQFFIEYDPYVLKDVRDQLLTFLASQHQALLSELYNRLDVEGDFSTHSGPRALKNELLQLMTHIKLPEASPLAMEQFESANMTLKLGALRALNLLEGADRKEALLRFYREFKGDTVSIDKWLSLHALYEGDNWLEGMNQALKDPVFDPLVPNKCYALLVAFGAMNTRGFHHPEGVGYRLIADWVLKIDKTNPQVAARLVSVFNPWKKMEPQRRALMKSEVERIVNTEGLSSNCFEIASKALV